MKVKVNIYFPTPARVRIPRSPQLNLTAKSDYAYPVDEEYLKKYSQNQERDESTNPTEPEDIRSKEKITDVNTGLIKSEDTDLPENRYLAYPVDDDIFKKLNVNESYDKAESVNSEDKNSTMNSYPAYPVDDAILGQFVSKEVIGEPRKSQDLLKLDVLATPIEKLEKNNYKQAKEEIESQDKDLPRNKYPVYPIDDEILGQFDKSVDAKELEKPGVIPKYLHTINPTELSKPPNPASPIHHGILKTPNQPESKAYDLPQLINPAYPIKQLEDISTITDESSKSANIGLNTYPAYPVDDEILEKVGLDASNSTVESSKSENLTQLTIGTLPNEQLEKNYTNVDVGKKSSNSGDMDLYTRYPIYPVDEEILKERDLVPDSKAKLSKSKDFPQLMSPTHPIRLLKEVNSEKADDKTETSKSVDLDLPARVPAYPVDDEIVKTFGLEEIGNKTVSNNSEVLQHNTTHAIGPLEEIDDAKLNGKVESSKLENQNVRSSDIPFLELYPHYKKTFEDLGFNKPSHEIQGPVADGKEESNKSQDMELPARIPMYPVEEEILENRGLEESPNTTESIKLEELPTLIPSYPSESLEEDKASGESDSSQSEKTLNLTSDGLFNVRIINKPIKAGHSLLAVRVSDSKTEADLGNSVTVPQLSPTQFSSTQLPSSQAPDIKVSVQSGIGDSILIKIDGLRDTLVKLVGEVIAKLDLSQVIKSEEAQTRAIGDDKDRNFDRLETESTKSKKLTTFIPMHPVESLKEIGKAGESKSTIKRVNQAKVTQEVPTLWSSYNVEARSFYKSVLQQGVFNIVAVPTKCYHDHGEKIPKILTSARVDLVKCGGKRLMEVYDSCVKEINSIFGWAMYKIRACICTTEYCIDSCTDNLSNRMDMYGKTLESKMENFLKIYKSEDEDVKECAYKVHRGILHDIFQEEFLMRHCIRQEFEKLLVSSTQKRTQKLNKIKIGDFQGIVYNTVYRVFVPAFTKFTMPSNL